MLTDNQSSLLSSFYVLSQERYLENGFPMPIKERDIYFHLEKHGSRYPTDLFVNAVRLLDSYYIEQRCKELNKAAK